MRGGGECWPEWAVQGEGEYGFLRAEENTLCFHGSHEGTPFSRWLVAHWWLPQARVWGGGESLVRVGWGWTLPRPPTCTGEGG